MHHPMLAKRGKGGHKSGMNARISKPYFSEQQAALAALHVAHHIGAGDAAVLTGFIARQTAFAAVDNITDAQAIAQEMAREVTDAPDGVETLLNLLAASLSGDAAATAYGLCADFIAAYGRVSPEEMRYLERLGNALGIDRLSRAAFDRAAQARATPLSADTLND